MGAFLCNNELCRKYMFGVAQCIVVKDLPY